MELVQSLSLMVIARCLRFKGAGVALPVYPSHGCRGFARFGFAVDFWFPAKGQFALFGRLRGASCWTSTVSFCTLPSDDCGFNASHGGVYLLCNCRA